MLDEGLATCEKGASDQTEVTMFWFWVLHVLALLFFIPALFLTIPLHIIAGRM